MKGELRKWVIAGLVCAGFAAFIGLAETGRCGPPQRMGSELPDPG